MTPRPGLLLKAAALPVAAATAAWTIHAIQEGRPVDATAGGRQVPVEVPVEVPIQELLPPVSVSAVKPIPKAVPNLAAKPAGFAAEAAAGIIPETALSAYQRAATVLADADPDCRLDWSLIAAIGRVESDHGRAGGNTLSASGVATPGIFGVPLTGAGATARILDTDGGTYDRDLVHDRAVGPMQFIPSTWSDVGVDADGDGRRDPQDVDDAALAAAVYLCSGSADLSTEAGQRSAVLRYNHSEAYVSVVLQIAEGYRRGTFETPAGVVLPAAQIPVTSSADLEPPSGASPSALSPRPSSDGSAGGTGTGTPSGGSTMPSSPSPSGSPATGGSGEPSPTSGPAPTDSPTGSPTGSPTETPTETPTVDPTPTPTETPSETPSETPTETPTETPAATESTATESTATETSASTP
ncbi:lytic transglycosylase domain-containing protein [Nocardioides sp. NPDC057767]|uniref:lytic transglycosylase domain-containing protein n=1 Tax=unclassified Nocardioides TaxID=2615069 RepID=UPI00366B0B25